MHSLFTLLLYPEFDSVMNVNVGNDLAIVVTAISNASKGSAILSAGNDVKITTIATNGKKVPKEKVAVVSNVQIINPALFFTKKLKNSAFLISVTVFFYAMTVSFFQKTPIFKIFFGVL